MKKSFLILVALAFVVTVLAGNRSKETMLRLAQQHMAKQRNIQHRAAGSGEVKLVAERPLMSIYTDGGQFVIINGDDRYNAVLAYGMGDFRVDSLPANVKWWMQAVEQAIARGVTSNRASFYKSVGPLMTSKWGQYEPYNNLAPEVKNDKKKTENAPTGCVATALAQVLNHQQYPASVDFQGSYTVDGDETAVTEQVTETFEWPYHLAYGYYYPDGYKSSKDYEEMPYTKTEADAVARLMRACGYAVDMDYSYEGSGAITYYAATALTEKFQYPEVAVKYLERDYFTTEEWLNMLHEEFQNGSPVFYGGCGTETGSDDDLYGHAFVLHGMDSDGLVYVNWGWQGSADGYYAIDLLNPDEETEFPLYQEAIIGIRPTALSTDVYQSLLATEEPYTISYTSKSSKLSLSLEAPLYNYAIYDLEGQVRFTIIDTTDPSTFLTVDIMNAGEKLESAYGWDAAEGFLEGKVSFTSGHTYQAYIESKDDRENDWQKVRTYGGAFYYELTCSQSGKVTISDAIFVGTPDTPTAIQSVDIEPTTDAGVRYFDLQGREVDANTHGLVIMKQGNKITKVFK